MEKVKRIFALAVLFVLSIPTMLLAQDNGTYIDNLGVQDSSYLEQDLLQGEGAKSASGTITAVIIVMIIIIAALIFFYVRKKKK